MGRELFAAKIDCGDKPFAMSPFLICVISASTADCHSGCGTRAAMPSSAMMRA